MDRDITPQLLEKYAQNGKCGHLTQTIPDCGVVSVDLSQLFKHATGLKFFESQTRPDEIEAMAVYGSTLYKHFPTTTETESTTRRKYWLFGPKGTFIETRERPRKFPNDFDVMVITKKPFTEDKVVVPVRHLEEDHYGSWEVIDFSAVETKRKVCDGYGYFEQKDGANLHITYRSRQQFLDGLGKGDELSESVTRYGIPIIGKERFEDMIKGVKEPKREALHQVDWSEDLEGRLQGKIN